MEKNVSNCVCGSLKSYSLCCQPYHRGEKSVPTAEALMRARYSAYVKYVIPFLKESYHPDRRSDFDESSVKQWSKEASWEGLEIIHTEAGGSSDQKGSVEFIAKYSMKGQSYEHHEVAEFERYSKDQCWYFVDGKTPKGKTYVRENPKVGRNDPCPCGSGKKFKKCCGA